MTRVVIGVDGGGSKTRVLVADARGEAIAELEGPASAVRPGEAEHSADVIAECVRNALAAAGVGETRPVALCVGVAGVGRPAEREQLWSALAARDIADEVSVLPDAQVALDDAFGDGPGILLIAGTGSVAFGRSPAGEVARVGGWGPVCGDEGSGAWIGRRALSVVTASLDGREPETALAAAVLTAAELNEAGELVAWAAAATPAQLATLAATVVSVAHNGDLRASSILDLAAEELALHVRALARRLFADERAACPVALAGGLLKSGSALRKRLERRLKSSAPGAQLVTGEVRPERGAMRAALALAGGPELPPTPSPDEGGDDCASAVGTESAERGNESYENADQDAELLAGAEERAEASEEADPDGDDDRRAGSSAAVVVEGESAEGETGD